MDLKLNWRLLGLTLFCVLLIQGASAAGECNKICTFEYNPMCGSDYNTYATQCVLEAEQCERASTLSVLYKGECVCTTSPQCTKHFQPHCGSDGVTYNNQCLFNFAKICRPELKLKNLGKCTSSGVDTAKCNTICTTEYNPVCGSDYKTYATRCVLETHRCQSGSALSVIYDGECTCDKNPVCTEEYQPHCGSDGKTYDNKCNFNFAQLCSPDLKLSKLGLCASMYDSGAATQLTLGLLSTTILTVIALFI